MENQLTVFNSFLAGILTFLSPCILALIPVYIGYLRSSSKTKIQIALLTFTFMLGIIITFLGMAFLVNGFSHFFTDYQHIIGIIGGVILIIMGLIQLGLFKKNYIKFSIKFPFNPLALNIFSSFLLGCIFGVSFTPCIGPFLSSFIILIMVNYAHYYWFYMAIYIVGLVIPFIFLGFIFTNLLKYLKKHQRILNIIYKLIAIVLIIIGSFQIKQQWQLYSASQITDNENSQSQQKLIFNNQYNQEINLEDYRGRYIMLNFIASWCQYCKKQIPLLEQFQKQNPEVAVFLVMNDRINNDGSDINQFGQTTSLMVLNDKNAFLFRTFSISGYPMSYYISPEFMPILKFAGYSQNVENLNQIYQQAQNIYNKKSNDVE